MEITNTIPLTDSCRLTLSRGPDDFPDPEHGVDRFCEAVESALQDAYPDLKWARATHPSRYPWWVALHRESSTFTAFATFGRFDLPTLTVYSAHLGQPATWEIAYLLFAAELGRAARDAEVSRHIAGGVTPRVAEHRARVGREV